MTTIKYIFVLKLIHKGKNTQNELTKFLKNKYFIFGFRFHNQSLGLNI